MKKLIILALIIIIIICLYLMRNIYENFAYKKVNLNKIEKNNNNKNLLVLLNIIKNNLDYHNDKLNKIELKLNQIYS
jgi:hypothetical protein|tara:strand:- start:410 stop:640 length:231 start_codon:yes stop_codon:yes gene_type:complete